MRNRFFLLVFQLVVVAAAAQQSYHFENFTTVNGLSHNEVHALLRDRQGFLWVGTANGLNRFDGYSFTNFLPQRDKSNSISGAAISSLAEDSKGNIWIAHFNGLEVYDPIRDTFILQSPVQDTQYFNWAFVHGSKLFIDKKDRVVVVNETADLIVLDSKTGTHRFFRPPPVAPEQRPPFNRTLEGNYLYGITRKSDTEAWVTSSHGTFSFNTETGEFQFYPMPDCECTTNTGFLFADTIRNLLWFSCFEDNLHYSFDYKTGKTRQWDIPADQPLISGLGIATTDAHHIWFSSLGVLDTRTEKFTKVSHISKDYHSVLDGSVAALYCDRDGILWVATTSGLSKLDPNLQAFGYAHVAAHPEEKYDNSIFEVYTEADYKTAYITSFYESGLYIYDFQTGQSSVIPSTIERPLDNMTRIYKDSYGITWLVAYSHIYQVDFNTMQFNSIPLPPLQEGSNRVITDMAEDTDGNLWFTKWRAGILFFDRQRNELRYIENPKLNTRLGFYVTASPNGEEIWISTIGDGVLGYNIRTKEILVLDTLVAKGTDLDILQTQGAVVDAANNLWIATGKGLARRTPDGAVRIFASIDGFPTDAFESITKDLKGMIWVTTASGVSSIDPKTFEIRNYDERHGLKVKGILHRISVSPIGELFIGVRQGFIRFHPDSIKIDQRAPNVLITSFKVNDKEYKDKNGRGIYQSTLFLRPDENFFSIEFAALNFTLPEDNVYYYQLEGMDEDWKIAGKNRTVYYTKVPPGRYKFRLKAKNKDGIWSEYETSLSIQVNAPFWQTSWFLALIGIGIAGMIFLSYQYHTQQIRRQERMKAEFDKKLAEVEMTALRSQMNPHFLFNCLNSINRFIQCNEPDAASAYLTKFSRLVRLVLDNSRTNTVTLRDELEALRLYLELESMRFVNRFKYVIDVSPALDKTSIDVPPMLIQPYVENAIWHGLMHKESDDCTLFLRIFADDNNQLIIEIEDNGIGRDAARELKSKSATLHKSHGMKVTAERIDIINEMYQTKATVHIEDLVYPDGQPAGTKVRLSLPI